MIQSIEELLEAAANAHDRGRLDEAQRLTAHALQLDPKNLEALLLSGVVLAKQGRMPEAEAKLRNACEEDSESFRAYIWHSVVLRSLRRPLEALQSAQRAVQLAPDNAMATNQLAFCLMDQREFVEAENWFRRAIESSPDTAVVHDGLGLALRAQGRNSDSIRAFRQAVELEPHSEPFLFHLVGALMADTNPSEAARWARQIVDLNPRSAQGHLILSRALLEDNAGAEALEHAEIARNLGADPAVCAATEGFVLRGLGRIEEAIQRFERSIEFDPNQTQAYAEIAQTKRLTESDRPLIDQMLRLAAEGGDDRRLGHLHYALGKSFEDLGDYDRAMDHFDVGNRAAYAQKFGSGVYDRDEHRTTFDRLAEVFSKEFIDAHQAGASDSETPIFVLGMMRSGTTLVEQILSSHPKVGAGGEQRFWLDNRSIAFDIRTGLFEESQFREIAQSYLELLHRIGPDKERIVDKMPTNYTVLGLLRIAFPKAKILHTVRNPVDTCISIYTTPNRSRIEWAHDKDNIVFAYRQYERLMDHWRNVVPSDQMLEVRYENLISNREDVTRQIVEFCGLDWNDSCLRPEANNRAVFTPSVWQVRQPVYTTSIDRWKRYRAKLGAFEQLVHEDTEGRDRL